MLGSPVEPTRRFYRIVVNELPDLADFRSNAAKGRPLRNPTPVLRDRWRGISVWESEELARAQARDLARRGRRLGEFIAEIVVDNSFRYEQTFGPGHYTLWGLPAALLARVVRVVRV